MQWKKLFLVAIAAVLTSGAFASDDSNYDYSVVCSKTGGVNWSVQLSRIGNSNQYEGTVYRNGVQLYGRSSQHLTMNRVNGRYWSSDLRTATLNIASNDTAIFETFRYNFSASGLVCSDGSVPESSLQPEAALIGQRSHGDRGLLRPSCSISDRKSQNFARIPMEEIHGDMIATKPATDWLGHKVKVIFTRPDSVEPTQSLRLKVDESEMYIDHVSPDGLYQFSGKDFVMDCHFG